MASAPRTLFANKQFLRTKVVKRISPSSELLLRGICPFSKIRYTLVRSLKAFLMAAHSRPCGEVILLLNTRPRFSGRWELLNFSLGLVSNTCGLMVQERWPKTSGTLRMLLALLTKLPETGLVSCLLLKSG